MIIKKIWFGAGIEIILLIISTFAFSYLVGEAFGKIETVSAQETSESFASKWGLNDAQYNDLRETTGWSDESLSNVYNVLNRGGYVPEGGFKSPEEAQNALSRLNEARDQTVNQVINGQTNSDGTVQDSGGFFDLINILDSIIPQFQRISGADFQKQLDDATKGIFTCPLSKDGKMCQQYTGVDCAGKCATVCISQPLNELTGQDSVCTLVNCYDEKEGTCQPRSPKGKCKDDGGIPLKIGSVEEASKCEKGCCTLADQALYVTKKQCDVITKGNGLEIGDGAADFKQGVNEPQCLMSVFDKEEGACIFDSVEAVAVGKKDCKFLTGEECTKINGDFKVGDLCSKTEWNTICTRQNKTDCVEGLDGVYWFDSCGNKENIYEGSDPSQMERSWNSGMFKNESCSLDSNGSPVGNQGTCGNCNRLRSSYCGKKDSQQKLNDINQDVVCRDMGCHDGFLNIRRENGESWCAYQGSIGAPGWDIPIADAVVGLIPSNIITDLIGTRSTDTVGSNHFRKYCVDGKIETAPCGNYRNEICVQSISPKFVSSVPAGLFSQAACRINRWQECLNYNKEDFPGERRLIGMAGARAGDIMKLKLMLSCGTDPDCFVKSIDITSNKDDTFKFSMCLPRYNPGFDLKDNAEAGNKLCSSANNQCTAIFVKEIAGWKCKGNCDCIKGSDPNSAQPSDKFVRQMNELCTSLGDCGSEVNYLGIPGAIGSGFHVCRFEGDEKKQFSCLRPAQGGFLGALPHIEDSDVLHTPGEFILAIDSNIIRGLTGKGLGGILGNEQNGIGRILQQLGGRVANGEGEGRLPGTAPNPEAGFDTGGATTVGLAVGGVGTAAGAFAWSGAATSVGAGLYTSLAASSGLTALGGAASTSAGAAAAGAALSAAASGFAGATLGAAAGMAIAAVLMDVLGISGGLSPGVAYTMIGVAGVGGSLIALSFVVGGWTGPVGIVMVVAVIIMEIIFAIMGVGEMKKITVAFECKAWEPPRIGIGTCETCGFDIMSDGSMNFPCNKYACQSLGSTCQYIESTEGPEGGKCVSLNIDDKSAPRVTGTRNEVISRGFEYVNLDNGFKIKKTAGPNGCLDQFETVTFGFNTDEYGRCGISGKQGASFEEMIQISSLTKEHKFSFSSRDLESLGVDIGRLAPESENNINLFIACEDAQGNHDGPRTNVNLCIFPRDLTAVAIIDVSPLEELLPYTLSDKEITIRMSERAECKWDYEDKSYNEMINSMDCSDGTDAFTGEYFCKTRIPLEKSETDICIKCLDHPEWAGTPDESRRNVNTECRDVNFKKTDGPLEIVSIKPADGEIIPWGTQRVSVSAEVEVSGGADGTADCMFSVDNGGWVNFNDGIVQKHSRIFDLFVEGEHLINVSCTDFPSGNKAEKGSRFNIIIDNSAANIARAYEISGNLYIETNEPSDCSFLNQPLEESNGGLCNFDFSQGNLMNTELGGLVHVTSFDHLKTYGIKCKDNFGNENGGCDIKIKTGFI